MSQLFVHADGHDWDDCSVCGCHARASDADLLAAVRRGVESGTIKGEEAFIEFNPELRCYTVDGAALEDGIYIVIGPVSDGGSET